MQRKIFWQSLILCIALAYAGCAGNSGPAKYPEGQVDYGHISFVPPKGSGWQWIKLPEDKTKKNKFDHSMLFVKLMSKSDAAAAGAHVNIFHRDEKIDKDKLLKYYDAVWIYPPDHPKYKIVDSQHSFDDSRNALCLLYANKNIEKKAPGFSGPVYITQNRGIICVHPKYRNEIYTLNTNQQYLRDISPTNLENEFDPFLNSLQLH